MAAVANPTLIKFFNLDSSAMAYEYLESHFAPLAAFLAGSSIHLLIFRKGEWDLWTVRILWILTWVHVAGFGAILYLSKEHAVTPSVAARVVAKIGVSMILGVFSSMLIYRGFFHRLNRFPGPFLARLSNFYITGRQLKALHLYEEVRQLHKQYGDIVRLGMRLGQLWVYETNAFFQVRPSFPSTVPRRSLLSMAHNQPASRVHGTMFYTQRCPYI